MEAEDKRGVAMEIDYKAIGQRIKIARIKKGVTQETVAGKIEMSLQHISNIETGNTKLSLPAAIAIANALDVSLDSLLCDNVLYTKPSFVEEAKDLFDDCNEYEVRMMVDMLRATKQALRKDKALREKME